MKFFYFLTCVLMSLSIIFLLIFEIWHRDMYIFRTVGIVLLALSQVINVLVILNKQKNSSK